jgi:phosphotransferase system  glucose/maltose/N-acetylglucosamine-specific IIC component
MIRLITVITGMIGIVGGLSWSLMKAIQHFTEHVVWASFFLIVTGVVVFLLYCRFAPTRFEDAYGYVWAGVFLLIIWAVACIFAGFLA